ncbi:hypothetical protein CRENBAI_000278 [Crenichthys baileyi]|uniref:Uncharacterized protein n=1 Tax=Crenichthys baileyi TaxID=28760 RepID=A0AAV9RP38_9TELE
MDTRPKRQTSVPSYLSDLSGPGAQNKLQTAATAALGVSVEQITLERPTIKSPSPPISQSFDMMNLVDDEEQEQELSQSMDQATGEQRTNQVPEFSAALEEIRQENAELCKQFQSLMVVLQSKPAAHKPLFPPSPPQGVYSGGYGHYQLPTNAAAYQQIQYPTLSSQGNLPQDFAPCRVSQPHSGLPYNLYYAATP